MYTSNAIWVRYDSQRLRGRRHIGSCKEHVCRRSRIRSSGSFVNSASMIVGPGGSAKSQIRRWGAKGSLLKGRNVASDRFLPLLLFRVLRSIKSSRSIFGGHHTSRFFSRVSLSFQSFLERRSSSIFGRLSWACPLRAS